MKNELNNVKPGDKVIVNTQLHKGIEVVERTTATLVITKYHRFNKKSGKALGGDTWSYVWARIGTEEEVEQIQKEAYRRNLISKCNGIQFNKLSNSQLEAILKISENHGKEM